MKTLACFTTKQNNNALSDEEAACISDDETTNINSTIVPLNITSLDEHASKSKTEKPLSPIQTDSTSMQTTQSTGNKGSTVGKGTKTGLEEMSISETSLGSEIKTLHIESNDDNQETKQKRKKKKHKKEKKRKEKANEKEMTEKIRSNKVYPDTDDDTDGTR